jgi:hypothetical protein
MRDRQRAGGSRVPRAITRARTASGSPEHLPEIVAGWGCQQRVSLRRSKTRELFSCGDDIEEAVIPSAVPQRKTGVRQLPDRREPSPRDSAGAEVLAHRPTATCPLRHLGGRRKPRGSSSDVHGQFHDSPIRRLPLVPFATSEALRLRAGHFGSPIVRPPLVPSSSSTIPALRCQ